MASGENGKDGTGRKALNTEATMFAGRTKGVGVGKLGGLELGTSRLSVNKQGRE